MSLKETTIGLKFILLVSILLILTSFLGACTNQQNAEPEPSNDNQKKTVPPRSKVDNWKLPIDIPEGEFYKLGGWLSDHQILYITNLEQTSSLYQYHLLTGKSELLYKSEVPIVTVQTSPEKKYILIQSSPSTYEGLITIIDTNGTELSRQSFHSNELAFEWNPYNESEILFSLFNEDWSYHMQLLDIADNKITELSLPQPFNKWVGLEEVAYLDWDDSNPTLVAPLMTKKIGVEEQIEVLPSIFQFSSFRDLLLTITVNKDDQKQSAYSFYNSDLELIYSFSIPHLAMFSGWLVPFYDFNESKGHFITFRPLKGTDVDSYSEDFELVAYDIKKGNSKVVLEGMKNEPISISPSGEAILYGNRLEKIIDLDTKKIWNLIKE